MFPNFTTKHERYSLLANTVSLRKTGLTNPAFCIRVTDLPYRIIGQLGQRPAFALALPLLLILVGVVSFLRTQKQVIGPYALGVVAPMQNIRGLSGNWPEVDLVANAMRSLWLSGADGDLPIAVFINGTGPQPACRGLADKLPKAFTDRPSSTRVPASARAVMSFASFGLGVRALKGPFADFAFTGNRWDSH